MTAPVSRRSQLLAFSGHFVPGKPIKAVAVILRSGETEPNEWHYNSDVGTFASWAYDLDPEFAAKLGFRPEVPA